MIARTTLLTLLAATPALAAEEVVTIPTPNGDVVGTLSLPDGAAAPAPAVLLLHGFTGSRNELPTEFVPEGIFARTAARLAEAGYASLRIDFRGSGESLADQADFAPTTFEGQVADATAALDWLAASDRVAGDDLFVLGWSQGGLVATAVAGRTDRPDAVALWAAVANPPETYGGLMGAEAMAAGMAAGEGEPVTASLPWGAEVTLNGAFFDGVETFSPTAELAGYAGPVFVAQGTLDTTVLPTSAEALIAAHEGPEELWTAEMDHAFATFTSDALLEEMIGRTVAFFDAHAD